MNNGSKVAALICALWLSGCALPHKRDFPSPEDYVPEYQIKISDRFVTAEVSRDNLVDEIQKCIPQFDSTLSGSIFQDFPNDGLTTIGNVRTANHFLLQKTTSVCIQQSTFGFPIYAAEALYGTVNPAGAPQETIDGWYREIALLLAKNGTAKIAYVFKNGAACVANYSFANTDRYSSKLSYSSVFRKRGTFESETYDATFTHPSLTSCTTAGYGTPSKNVKDNPLRHRSTAQKRAAKVPRKPAPAVPHTISL